MSVDWTRPRVIWEEGLYTEKCLHYALGNPVRLIFQLTLDVGGAIPGQVGLSGIRKTKKAVRSKP